MGCLKCGKETDEKQVFCQSCSQGMEKQPVKPGTAVQLYIREPKPQEKKGQKRRAQDPRETVGQLRRLIRLLTATVALMTFVICFLAGLLIYSMRESTPDDNIGRNYTTDTTQQAGG